MPIKLLRMKQYGTEMTKSERLVVKMLAMGKTQVEIAHARGVSLETVRKQSKSARARLGASTNAHAVAIAISLDMI